MSNLAKALESECQIVSGCNALKRVINPNNKPSDKKNSPKVAI